MLTPVSAVDSGKAVYEEFSISYRWDLRSLPEDRLYARIDYNNVISRSFRNPHPCHLSVAL